MQLELISADSFIQLRNTRIFFDGYCPVNLALNNKLIRNINYENIY